MNDGELAKLSILFREVPKMPNPHNNEINIDPATLLLIVSALIFLPLLFAGFMR